MPKRYLYLWFRFLPTDRMSKHKLALRDKLFLLYAPECGRMVVRAVSPALAGEGMAPGMVVADIRAVLPGVEVLPAEPEADAKLLNDLAGWCFRFSPTVAVDPPDGLSISRVARICGVESSLTSMPLQGVCSKAAIMCVLLLPTPLVRLGRWPVMVASPSSIPVGIAKY